jgi:hypothetical protein
MVPLLLVLCGAAADVITPDDVFDVLEEDVRETDLILWVGMSFQQSASTAYFRRVRHYLQVGSTLGPGQALSRSCESKSNQRHE